MPGTSSSTSVSTTLQRIAELARGSPSAVLTTLAHHIDVEFLREAYRCTRKDGVRKCYRCPGGQGRGAPWPVQVAEIPRVAERGIHR
jgi:hypothetical protein